MSGIVGGLAGVRRTLVRRRALALALGFGALAAVVWAVAALAARLGAFTAVRWGPLALWIGALVALGLTTRAVLRVVLVRAPAALREVAALVEGELALRRGALVGVVDLAGGVPAGTSSGLAACAAEELERSLPAAGPATWAPVATRILAARVRVRAAACGGALVAAGLALHRAGDAAAALVSPTAALRAAASAHVAIAASARAVPRGGSVVVRVDAGSAGRPTLFLRATGEAWRPVLLASDAAGRASHRIADLRAPIFVYAAAGGASSETLQVRVIEPAFVAEFAVTARYPAYLGRADELLVTDAGPLAVPTGTVLEVRGAASAPLARAALVAGGDTALLREDGAAFAGNLVVRGTARWKLALADRFGGPVPEPLPALDVRAVPDSAPVVQVPVPGTDTTAPLDLKPAFVVDARDDHSLGRVEILSWRVSRLGVAGDTAVDSIPGVAGADRIVQSQVLDLTDRNLLPGDTVRFFVRASDRAPVPHVGRSREYALRLRTLSELREAVREGTDSLSREAAGLAADQSALSRQTEDLAVQHHRSGEATQARAESRENAAGERPPRSGAVNFEQAQAAQRIAERQRELAERAAALRDELQRLAKAAEEAGLNDPQWQQRLRDLDDLLRQAITPELAQRLEELRRALERLDPRAVQDALRRLSSEQQRLREELQRSAELFERAALEGAMQTLAQNAEELQRAEREWAQRAPQQRDSAGAGREQRRLEADTDSLRRALGELAERMRERGDSATAAAVDSAAGSAQQAESQMDEAAQSMEGGRRGEAGERGERAAQALQPVPQRLRERQRQMSAGWRIEVLRSMDAALEETIALAAEENRLAEQLRRGEGSADARGRQSAMEQGINQVLRRLQRAAGRHALVSPRLGAALGQARERVGNSRRALEGPSQNADEAAQQAQDAAQALSQAAFQLMRNRDQVAGAQSGSGFAEALQRMAELAGRQGQLNDQLGGLIPMLGGGQEVVLQQLRALAARQRALANELERLGERGLPGRPEQLADEARQLADRIEQARLDRSTLERQQRLFRRMLDAGRTLRNDDEPEDPERTSETARARAARVPAGTAQGATLRYPVPSWATLRNLSPAERAMVLDYFRRLNATVR